MRYLRSGFLTLAVLVGSSVQAESAKEILESVRDAQIERWEGVALYSVTQEVMGQSVTTYFQRFSLRDEDGSVLPSFHMVSEEAFRCENISSTPMTEEEITSYLSNLAGAGSNVEASANASPGSMLLMKRLINSAELVGEEAIDDQSTWHVVANDVDYTEGSGEGSFRIDDFSLWIDQSRLVPLQMHMKGVSAAGSETRIIDMQMLMSDYQIVGDTSMLEAYTHNMRMNGMLSEKEMAEVKDAQKQLAEFDMQMAAMPESQRKMMERLMGDQIKMFRELADSGSVNMQTIVSAIIVNEDARGETCAL